MRMLNLVAVAFIVASTTGLEAQAQKTLYQRLGERKAIVAVVDDFVANCAARINKFFAAMAKDPARLAAF